jgi:hypothetical protein
VFSVLTAHLSMETQISFCIADLNNYGGDA